MNSTPRPTVITSPPRYKRRLSTLVDKVSVPLHTREGKRRLFRHSVWPYVNPAFPGWTSLTFWPGWLSNTASGRICLMTSEVCPTGELDATLDRIQAEHGVHLWLRPIRVPTTWPRGNWWWPEGSRNVWELHLDKAHTGLKAVAG